jgi:hypothetical protein
MRIAILNGSLGGNRGNSQVIEQTLVPLLRRRCPQAKIETFYLKDEPTSQVLAGLQGCSGYIFLTGTYWDSWGSPLQTFLEEATIAEGTETWLGKPVAVIVSAHSVGAKGVLSRLQGVLNTLGCLIPPMSGLVLTAATQQALENPPDRTPAHREDFWSLGDLPIIVHNLATAIEGQGQYQCWEVDRKDPAAVWVK